MTNIFRKQILTKTSYNPFIFKISLLEPKSVELNIRGRLLLIDWGGLASNRLQTFLLPAGEHIIRIYGERFTCVFYGQNVRNDITEIVQFGNVEIASQMFRGSRANLENVIDVPRFYKKDAGLHLFNGWTGNFVNRLDEWDVSDWEILYSAFTNTPNFNQDLNSWDTSKVTDMSGVFLDAKSFNGKISSWDVSSATNMSNMFLRAESFDRDIGGWNTSNVEKMTWMFANTPFNQDISNWDVRKVTRTNMERMFSNASLFNQDLSDWCVEHINTQPNNFRYGTPNWTLPKPNWGQPCI